MLLTVPDASATYPMGNRWVLRADGSIAVERCYDGTNEDALYWSPMSLLHAGQYDAARASLEYQIQQHRATPRRLDEALK